MYSRSSHIAYTTNKNYFSLMPFKTITITIITITNIAMTTAESPEIRMRYLSDCESTRFASYAIVRSVVTLLTVNAIFSDNAIVHVYLM